MKLFSCTIILSLLCMFASFAKQMPPDNPPYKNAGLPVETRVADLLTRMTLEEKIDLLGGTGFATMPNERLGIPELRMTDGPLGVRWDKATAFPSGIALGATWDAELVFQVGKSIAREVKAKGRHVILGPCVNIARIPQGGRNFESFGEDPFLTSFITIPYIKGVQSENVVATVKHFACNNQEFQRDFVDVKLDDRSLNEIYLPAFKAAVEDADVLAFMCSYNRVNGYYASESDPLLIEKLKKEWGFNYLVMSDWGAVHSSIPVAKGGLDLEMPDGKYLNRKTLLDAVKSGTVAEDAINDKVKRILRVIFKIGLFENPGNAEPALLGTKGNRTAAFEAGRAGIVLLQNKDNILPLDVKHLNSVAIIGPGAAKLRAGGGGSSQVDPLTSVSPLEALKTEFGNTIKIVHAEGVKMIGDAMPIEAEVLYTDAELKEHGLKGEYYSNMELKGTPAFTRVDKQVNFDWGGESPEAGFPVNKFSVRWTGYLQVQKSGDYIFETLSDDGQRLYIDDKLVINDWNDHGFEGRTAKVSLEVKKKYKIVYEFYENGGSAAVRLAWNTPAEKLITEAVKAATESEVAIIFAGTTSNIESEGIDRESLDLPHGQTELIQAVAKANKNTIVVITSGSPVLMDAWINDVKAVVETWFGGEMMGHAITDVLTGKYNPCGKLPVTFPRKWEDCSAFKTYKAMDSVTYYSDGIYVGYRHYEKNNIKPLFPFGFGLSYTTFKYANLKITPVNTQAAGKVTVSFTVKNTGTTEGAEVAQLYLHDVNASVDRPRKELKGFQKVMLKPGEEKTVTINMDKEAMSFYHPEKKQWVAEPGEFNVLIGASSGDIKLNGSFKLE